MRDDPGPYAKRVFEDGSRVPIAFQSSTSQSFKFYQRLRFGGVCHLCFISTLGESHE